MLAGAACSRLLRALTTEASKLLGKSAASEVLGFRFDGAKPNVSLHCR